MDELYHFANLFAFLGWVFTVLCCDVTMSTFFIPAFNH